MLSPQALAVAPRRPKLDRDDLLELKTQSNELFAYLRWMETQLQLRIAREGSGDFERAIYADVRAALGNARWIDGAISEALA